MKNEWIIGNNFSIKIDLKSLQLDEYLSENVDILNNDINKISFYLNDDMISMRYDYVDPQYFNEEIKNKIYKRTLEFIDNIIKGKENEVNNLKKIKKNHIFNNIIRKEKLNKIL